MKNKRGIVVSLGYILVMALVGVLILGIVAFVVHMIRGGLNQDVMIGQANLSNISEGTLGVVDDSLKANLDVYGLFLIFGMIIGFFIAAFMLRGQWNKILILVDILLLIAFYIMAVLISNAYELSLIAFSGVIDTFEVDMPKTSNFLLHLPRYVAIIGVVAMILFYTLIPRREDERQQQGVQYQEY